MISRWQWLLLVLAVAVTVVLAWRAQFGTDPTTARSERSNAPELLLETATIEQFDEQGALRYALSATRIAHYPERAVTLVTAPRLRMVDGGVATWAASAQRGQVRSKPDSAEDTEEIVLDGTVDLRRTARGEPLHMRTEHLAINPLERTAWTERPVIIDTASGQTRAAGMKSELQHGRVRLDSGDRQRVTTVVQPNTF